jgi:hypothetical protein
MNPLFKALLLFGVNTLKPRQQSPVSFVMESSYQFRMMFA